MKQKYNPTGSAHDAMIAEWMNDPMFKSEYDALEEDFALFDELIKARNRAGLTQEKVARRMGTRTPAVARIESGGGKRKHSPSIATLRKYAEACGYKIKIKLVPKK
jgi:DNA-binding XRE family transcriptional regulator